MAHEYSEIGKGDVAPVKAEEAAPAGTGAVSAAQPVNVDAVKT